MELSLYKVSETFPDQKNVTQIDSENQLQKSYTPKTKEYVSITISQMFLEVLLSEGKYFSSFQPLTFEKSEENTIFVTGSAIYE